MKMLPLSLAIFSALAVSATAQAGQPPVPNGDGDSDAVINKIVTINKNVDVSGYVGVDGYIHIESQGLAVTETVQGSDYNMATHDNLANDATIEDNYEQDAVGNLGNNQASGHNNMQSNSASLAVSDAQAVFGMSDAEAFTTQAGHNNNTTYNGSTNSAHIDNYAFQNVRGNLGVNQASGDNNAQSNSLAVGLTTGTTMAGADNVTQQMSGGNTVHSSGDIVTTTTIVRNRQRVALAGRYSGWSDQDGDVYPDSWDGAPHPDGSSTGHFDLDGGTQGAQDAPNQSGDNGAGGALLFWETGTMRLAGTITGVQGVTAQHFFQAQNNTRLGDNVLQNARGNIGINQAAGSGNLQSNSLTLSMSREAAAQTGRLVFGGPQP